MSKKVPPKFCDGTPYSFWKNKVEMWQLVTPVPKKEQAIVVVLEAFEGNTKAERAVSELSTEHLHHDNGMLRLFAHMDTAFKTEKVDEAYTAYTNFTQFSKQELMSMNDYVLEFEHLNHKLALHDMKLPNTILAFRLLDGANLGPNERQLALTVASDLKYETMKSALKRIFQSPKPLNNVQEESYVGSSRYAKKRINKGSFKQNPPDKTGRPTRCRICESTMHWAPECPHRNNARCVGEVAEAVTADVDQCEEVELTLATNLSSNEIFVIESSHSAILDTACTRTVCGETWFNSYCSNLAANLKGKVKVCKKRSVFKFGDGEKVISSKEAVIPAFIAGKKLSIKVCIVASQIPLLLSKASLKKASTQLDLSQDKVKMFGKPVKVHLTSSGHYCIEILPRCNNVNLSDDVLLSDTLSQDEVVKALKKLHVQFGHASEENLLKLLKNANAWKKDYATVISDVVQSCEVCAIHKRPVARPVVSLPWASDVNETVAMDLHEIEPGLWYYHMIDLFSRFSCAVIIKSKSSSVIVKNFLKYWISIFGAPKHVLSDNGREFDNQEFRDMCAKFGISVKTTPAYSPWSNGVCERHNMILTNILQKVKMESACDWDTCLAWSLSAKNSMINNNGFSPNQIVFGRNPHLPSILTDSLSALEDGYGTVESHMAALHTARKAFVTSQTSEKIRRALRKQTRQTGQIFNIGDQVYYKRDDQAKWRGPGKVLGQDGAVVFIRHGGQFIKAHVCRVQATPNTPVNHQSDTQHEPTISSPSSNCIHGDNEDSSDDEVSNLPQAHTSESTGLLVKGKNVLHKTVQFLNDKGTCCTAKVLSRAGKATGKFKNSFNVEYVTPDDLKGKMAWVNFDNVEDLCVLPENVDIIDEVYHTDVSFQVAKEEELKSWKRNGVYKTVPYKNQKCISVRWVCTTKEHEQGVKAKARLVARGFEETDRDTLDRESPTCSKDGLRVLLSIAKQQKWELKSIDIKTAFLQGETLDRNIYVKPPREANCSKDVIWKLEKCVYGLVDASKSWYRRVKQFMLDHGAKISILDRAIFYWHDGNVLHGYISVYVDDFLWAGSNDFEHTIVKEIRRTFCVGKEQQKYFKYIGLEVDQSQDSVSVSQSGYVKNLQEIAIPLFRKKHPDDELTPEEKETLRSKIGQLLWIATQTRPDLSFDVCVAATHYKSAVVGDLIACNKIIRKAQSDHVTLKYSNLGDNSKLKVVVYTDAAFANLLDGGSQGAYLVFLMGQKGQCNLLSWQSKRIRRVVRSTLAAETLAMSDGLETAFFLTTLWNEVLFGSHKLPGLPIEAFTDSCSLCAALHSCKSVSDKRLRVDIGSVKEMMEQHNVIVSWVSSEKQLADCLTKKTASSLALSVVLDDGQIKKEK
uniref:Uncharacterized protein LOC100184952 n=1 Tax=Phallusia mammillata TaxID=59560 RepID=A0A6F9DI73_9ASCI|nr:uncharacterized protein LOC100184952 [Phallusia mammillata]